MREIPSESTNIYAKTLYNPWLGNPEEGWFPWLKKEASKLGFEVVIPQLPNSDEPRIKAWVGKLKEVVGIPDEQTFFVGHSMGCQTIARYLEGLPDGIKVGGVIFVAGFFKRLTGPEDEVGDQEIVRSVEREWLQTPIDFEKIRSKMKKSVALFSDDDPSVPLDNIDDFRDKMGSQIIIEKNKGHFSEGDGITELPVVLDFFK